MSLKNHLAGLTAAIADQANAAAAAPQGQAAKRGSAALSAPGQLMQFSEGYRQLNEELERLRAAGAGQAVKLPLTQLKASPYQVGGLQQERVDRLVAVLRHNPLNTPVVVRSVGKDYELLAGHHRVEAYRVLGRTEIESTVVSFGDEQARALVFLDNLHAPSIPDYHRYLGFADLQKATGLLQDELADKAGISRATVGRLLAFGRLPEAVHPLLAAAPDSLTAAYASALAAYAKSHEPKVIEAVRLVCEGKLLPSKAVGHVAGTLETEAPKISSVMAGRKKFADISVRKGVVQVRLSDAESTAKVAKAIAKALKEVAGSEE